MSWTHYLSEEERKNLEDKAAQQFANLVRKALWAGLLYHIDQDRKQQGPPSLLRPPAGVRPSNWEQTLNNKIDGVVMNIDARTGNYGRQGIMWVEQQFADLKQSVTGLFTAHEER